MRILIVYAHPYPKSFNHAILESFTRGLTDGGNTFEVVDLYAIKFNPIVQMNDLSSCIREDTPEWVLELLNIKEMVINLSGGPIKRFIAKRWMRDKDLSEVAKLITSQKKPKDILEQQAKVAQAEAIVFISPIWWNNFPTILKGWVERVFSYGFAYSLTEEGWRGSVNGRIPLLKLKKALIINTLFFQEEAYKKIGLEEAMRISIDEWGLKYPGIPEVNHVYFYTIYGVDNETRKGWLEKTYRLGKEF
ncbi:MAG: NAD(P)H-dependent oxidoreductase [Dehalococcoidia bacterium]|nr:MAG: NAD(P)H-dependent oxidoreductase [Dehalococcoidia bacterium]